MDGQTARLIARGREADVYEHGDGLVLRRYRQTRTFTTEATAMRLAAQHGFPVPKLVEASGTTMIMERVDGPTMLVDVQRRPWMVNRHAETLAELHQRLHEIRVPGDFDRRYGEGDRLLHLDLHPENVIISAQGPVVIDWPNASAGDGLDDVAYSWVIMATSVVPAGPLKLIAGALRGQFIARFVRAFPRAELRSRVARVAEFRLHQDRHLVPGEADAIRRLISEMG